MKFDSLYKFLKAKLTFESDHAKANRTARKSKQLGMKRESEELGTKKV